MQEAIRCLVQTPALQLARPVTSLLAAWDLHRPLQGAQGHPPPRVCVSGE